MALDGRMGAEAADLGQLMKEDARPYPRLIARLDIKGENLIKGVQLEGLRVIGNPKNFSSSYYAEGIEEILYIDSVASLYGRSYLDDILESVTRDVFVPITVGGGVRSLDDVRRILRLGADKIALNTEAVRNPPLVSEIAAEFGNQCVVASIQAKRGSPSNWEVLTDGGRERTGLDVCDWAEQLNLLGAGEILLTSVDMDGTKRGFDISLIERVRSVVDIPVIASGGLGTAEHLEALLTVVPEIDAIAVGAALHAGAVSVSDLKKFIRNFENN